MQRDKRVLSSRVRAQYRLERTLDDWVRAEARRRGIPFSAIINWAVAAYRNQQMKSPSTDCQPDADDA